jgi:hypothetical protein
MYNKKKKKKKDSWTLSSAHAQNILKLPKLNKSEPVKYGLLKKIEQDFKTRVPRKHSKELYTILILQVFP